jgi:hypothetical protein
MISPHKFQGAEINQKATFDPEATRAMALAFDMTCHALGITDQADPITSKLIAERIIDFAQRGVRDPDQLSAMTMRALS